MTVVFQEARKWIYKIDNKFGQPYVKLACGYPIIHTEDYPLSFNMQ